jgi:futalosine hydrolase
MHILLAAATPFEIQPIIDLQAGRTSAENPASPHRLSTLITGIGSLATGWSLMQQIDSHRPDLIIQAGIAGCFTDEPPGEVLVIRDETLADLGVWEDGKFNSIFDLRLSDPDQPPFSRGRLVNPYSRLIEITGLRSVSAVTVNEISTSPERIEWLRSGLAPTTESMEGGALHYVCLRERVPFLQIRSVSNKVGIRDKTKWDIQLAIRRLNDRLVFLLGQLDLHDSSIPGT